MKNEKFLITISGPSTAGKSTLAELFKIDGFSEIVSTTTRPQRTGEKEGVSYYFTNENNFTQSLENDELVEHIKVGKYSYGVSKKAISDALERDMPAILVIEPHGANKVAEYCKEQGIVLHKVFINNDYNVLIERLQKRFEEDKNAKIEVYQERLWNIAVIEPKEWTQKAYNGEHFYDQIFDTFLPDNQNEVKSSILDAVQKKLTRKTKIKP